MHLRTVSTNMNRRHFLRFASTACAAFCAGGLGLYGTSSREPPWRTYEITTEIEVLDRSGQTTIWVPQPLIRDTPFQRSIKRDIRCDGGAVRTFARASQSLGIVSARFSARENPNLTVTNWVATRNWSVDVSTPGTHSGDISAELRRWLQPTRYIPTAGLVKERATEITKGATTDLDKARAIYEWIVENTSRNRKTRGCGRGDVRFMLESGDLSGKCADINALYVGLARASGLPARDVYGIRIGPCHTGYQSLGTHSGNSTSAQHCRAEVYLRSHGWVPVDPADVRKVMLEESPGHLSPTSRTVEAVRSQLFGSWEMNWMAYSYAQDVSLPGSNGPPLKFFMYPQSQSVEGWLDCLAPENFRYHISSREI